MHEINWSYPVIFYLFLAGLGAGAVTVSASVLLRKGGFVGASRFRHCPLWRADRTLSRYAWNLHAGI